MLKDHSCVGRESTGIPAFWIPAIDIKFPGLINIETLSTTARLSVHQRGFQGLRFVQTAVPDVKYIESRREFRHTVITNFIDSFVGGRTLERC